LLLLAVHDAFTREYTMKLLLEESRERGKKKKKKKKGERFLKKQKPL